MKSFSLFLGVSVLVGSFFLSSMSSRGDGADHFVKQTGTDKTFEELKKEGALEDGSRSTAGVKGSKVEVDESLLKDGPNAARNIPKAIKLHTLGNSSIPRGDFARWSRWYQEDGNTQIFRLFKGEVNMRNSRKMAARVEAFSDLKWEKGDWHEWVGTYTIIKPHGAMIFQVKNHKHDWGVALGMDAEGNVKLNHRRGEDATIATKMVGKPFHIRVRDNGHDYEVYLNGELKGKGAFARPTSTTSFRWGMYLGASEAKSDAMILVTGAGIDVKDAKE